MSGTTKNLEDARMEEVARAMFIERAVLAVLQRRSEKWVSTETARELVNETLRRVRDNLSELEPHYPVAATLAKAMEEASEREVLSALDALWERDRVAVDDVVRPDGTLVERNAWRIRG